MHPVLRALSSFGILIVATTSSSVSAHSIADNTLIADLVVANHILAAQGVVDGFGHISVRSATDPNHYYMARSMAPALVTATDIIEYDLDSNPLDDKGRKSYVERYIHGEIFKARPDVKSVVHSHSTGLIPFGVTAVPLRPIYHMSAFLGGGVPIFDIRDAAGDTDLLVKDAKLGQDLARTLGNKPVCLMRGHGVVVVGDTIAQTVFRSVYTEINAKIQTEAQKLGPVTFLDDGEATLASESINVLSVRSWELWKRQVEAAH
jgi:ribulose-5-phosphate 4-epimerase/fuculose-1-phosphate aldolase